MSLLTAIGFVGVLLYLLAYALLSLEKIDGNGSIYILLILGGALCVLLSLIEKFNAPLFVTQSIWIILSLFALARIHLFKKKEKNRTKTSSLIIL